MLYTTYTMPIPKSTKGIPKFIFPSGVGPFVNELGGTSMVCHVGADQVLKSPFEFDLQGCDKATCVSAQRQIQESRWCLAREKEVYQHLGQHDGILRYLEISESGLLFPLMKNGNLRSYLARRPDHHLPLTLDVRLAFVYDALYSIAFIHSRGVLQSDISARNFLVGDDRRSLLLCDFAGSALPGAEPLVSEETRYRKVQGIEDDSFATTITTELFAVGCLLFEIMTDKRPYDELSDEEVERRYAAGLFPSTERVPVVGHVIRRCWAGAYQSATEVIADVRAAAGVSP